MKTPINGTLHGDEADERGMHMPFDNSYARDLVGFYVRWKPAGSPAPRLLQLNRSLAAALTLPLCSITGCRCITHQTHLL